MSSWRTRTIAGIAVAAILAVGWLLLAPPQLGGSTRYAATVGNSMEPLFHRGDLAVVRPAPSYRAGQVVLYESRVLHRPVLHRILVVQRGHYFFKGDNNDFVDPGYATRADLLGTLWFRVPRAGGLLGWFGAPFHAALVGGVAALALLLAGRRPPRRIRRRTRRRGTVRPVIHSARRRFHRPRKTPLFFAGVAAAVGGAVLLAAGLTHPTQRTVQLAAYTHSGRISYLGRLRRPSPGVYPSGVAETGMPLFLSRVGRTTVTFAYRFRSGLPHVVHGTIALRALLRTDNGWHNAYVLARPVRFAGDGAEISATADLSALTTLLTQLARESGSTGSSYDLELRPEVRYAGIVAGHRIHGVFAPTLPFRVDQAVLRPEPQAAPVLPGAGYATPSAGSALAAALNPSETGSLPQRRPEVVGVAFVHATTAALRLGGVSLALGALLLIWVSQTRRRKVLWSHERRLAHRSGCLLVEVAGLADASPGLAGATIVPTFAGLVALAKQSERPVLHERRNGADLFAVDDPPRLYVHRKPAAPSVPSPAEGQPAAPATVQRARAGWRVGRLAALLGLLLVVATFSVTLTSGNLVPGSLAGASTMTRSLRELLPPQCAGLSPSTLVVATGSTTTGTSGSDLILGRSAGGQQTLNGGGGDDCIVAGGRAGTTNTIDGGSGNDVCIGAAASGATNKFSLCEATY